jgi:hypothetical protein
MARGDEMAANSGHLCRPHPNSRVAAVIRSYASGRFASVELGDSDNDVIVASV